MQLLNESQEKYYCSMCSRILSNGTNITCSCDQTHWCVTCANYQNRCLNCKILICNDCGFSPEPMICKECNLDKLLMIKKSAVIHEERCSDCDKHTLIKQITKCDFCEKGICIQCTQHHLCMKKYFNNKFKKTVFNKIMLMPEHLIHSTIPKPKRRILL